MFALGMWKANADPIIGNNIGIEMVRSVREIHNQTGTGGKKIFAKKIGVKIFCFGVYKKRA